VLHRVAETPETLFNGDNDDDGNNNSHCRSSEQDFYTVKLLNTGAGV
jgi:hypothetical protein